MAGGLGSSSRGGLPGPKRVLRTGLALVHENEIVYPAAGSEAQVRRVVDDANADIHMHFPVVIEVIAAGAAQEAGAAADAASLRNQQDLARALRSR